MVNQNGVQSKIEMEDEIGRIIRKDGFISVRAVKRSMSNLVLDLRHYHYAANGEIKPTVKGFTVFLSNVPELQSLIQKFADKYCQPVDSAENHKA